MFQLSCVFLPCNVSFYFHLLLLHQVFFIHTRKQLVCLTSRLWNSLRYESGCKERVTGFKIHERAIMFFVVKKGWILYMASTSFSVAEWHEDWVRFEDHLVKATRNTAFWSRASSEYFKSPPVEACHARVHLTLPPPGAILHALMGSHPLSHPAFCLPSGLISPPKLKNWVLLALNTIYSHPDSFLLVQALFLSSQEHIFSIFELKTRV